MASFFPQTAMNTLPEFVGTVHIFLGPYRGNPIALYLRKEGETCHISPHIYPWNLCIGSGETVNKAAAAFEEKWKQGDLLPEMYSGPHWEGGIKPEKPKPPPKPPAASPGSTAPARAPATPSEPAQAQSPSSAPTSAPSTPPAGPSSTATAPTPQGATTSTESAPPSDPPKEQPGN